MSSLDNTFTCNEASLILHHLYRTSNINTTTATITAIAATATTTTAFTTITTMRITF